MEEIWSQELLPLSHWFRLQLVLVKVLNTSTLIHSFSMFDKLHICIILTHDKSLIYKIISKILTSVCSQFMVSEPGVVVYAWPVWDWYRNWSLFCFNTCFKNLLPLIVFCMIYQKSFLIPVYLFTVKILRTCTEY